jgi:hypothetical protein
MLCAAGLDHQQLKQNDDAWALLTHVDDQYLPPVGDYPAERYEQRTCGCGSTIARRAPTNDPPAWWVARTKFPTIEAAALAACEAS